MQAETIAAVATPPGKGGVAIVRISGPAALDVLRAVCPSFPAHERLTPHKLVLVRAVGGVEGRELLDVVLAVFMPGPRSYTGEDVAELHAHGGEVNTAGLLAAVCDAGARPAGPGEFTQRAFVNGRLDLTQAEAVADVINATSVAALRLAQRHLQGALGARLDSLYGDLEDLVTLTEAAIDFSQEEDVYSLDVRDFQSRARRLEQALEELLGTYDAGRQMRDGLVVVVAGRPNAGKSTLFNLLCGRDRAIVTPTAGTTRDFLEEPIEVAGCTVILTDTAGIHPTADSIEAEGVERALGRVRAADIVLWVLDTSDPRPLELATVEEVSATHTDIQLLVNKVDRDRRLREADLRRAVSFAGGDPLWTQLAPAPCPDAAAIFSRLEQLVRRRVDGRTTAAEGVSICRERHRRCLIRAREAMEAARLASAEDVGIEIVALELRTAADAIGEVLGRRLQSGDVLDSIFGLFCVGK